MSIGQVTKMNGMSGGSSSFSRALMTRFLVSLPPSREM
jgi:hypothetical protein